MSGTDATAALQPPAPAPAPAPAPTQPKPLSGQLIGKYRIGKELGRGGMGAVFVAVHETIGQRAAVKILFPQFARMRGAEDRFFYEARMANLVKHPGLVQVFDHGHLADGTSYILMEFLDGQSLQAKMSDGDSRGERRSRTALPELLNVLRIGRQIALILQSVHEKGIVHRDLKPGNILLCPDPIAPSGERVKLIDFGIAKIQVSSDVLSTNEAAPQTRVGSVLGTPKYMSPEQCQGQSNLDGKADVYALGVILYELLSGQAPFHSPQTGTLLAMHIFKEPPPLRTPDKGDKGDKGEPGVPVELAALVHRMLAKAPKDRPSSSEVAAELERLERELSAPPPVPPRASGLSVPVAAVLLVAAVLATWAAVSRLRSAPPGVSSPATAPAAAPPPAPDKEAAPSPGAVRPPPVAPTAVAPVAPPPAATTPPVPPVPTPQPVSVPAPPQPERAPPRRTEPPRPRAPGAGPRGAQTKPRQKPGPATKPGGGKIEVEIIN